MGAFTQLASRIPGYARSFSKEMLISSEKALARQGPMSGYFAQLLRAGRDAGEMGGGKIEADVLNRFGWLKRNPNFDYVVEQMDKGIMAADPTLAQAGIDLSLLDEIGYRGAQGVGIRVAPRVQTHFPHRYPDEIFIPGHRRDAAIQHLVSTKQAANYAKGEELLDMMRSVPSVGRVHTLETRRTLNLPGWRRDFDSMLEHLTAVGRRTEEAKIWGPEDEQLTGVLSQIQATEGQAAYEYAKTVYDLVKRQHSGSKVSELERGVSSFQIVSKLGLAVIGNSTQPLNNVLLAGVGPSLKAMRDVVLDWGNSKDFALRTGAIYGSSLMDLRRELGVHIGTLGEKTLQYTGFNAIEQFNRVYSTRVGHHFAEDSVTKLLKNPLDKSARETLTLLGIDPMRVINAGLSPDDLLVAGKRVSDLTQFRNTVLELPKRWKQTPEMRMLTMYKSFAFNQAKFIKDHVFKPALKGDMRPLIYFSTIFPIAGEAIADIKTLVRRGDLKSRPDGRFILDRLVDNYLQLGSLGILADMMYGLSSPNDSTFLRFLGGPLAGDVADAHRVWQDFWQRKEFDELGKQVTRRVPVVGPIVSDKLFGQKQKTKSFLQSGGLTKAADRFQRKLEE